MVDRCRSGLELEVDIESCEELENMDGVGEEGRDSGRLKERVKVVLDGGVVADSGERVWAELCLAHSTQSVWGSIVSAGNRREREKVGRFKRTDIPQLKVVVSSAARCSKSQYRLCLGQEGKSWSRTCGNKMLFNGILE